MSAWKEKRKHIKKLQKIKRPIKDKFNETNYTISEIHSFSTLAIPSNNTHQIGKIENVNCNFFVNNSKRKKEIIIKNETPASTPHFEIQNFNNFEISSLKCQPVIPTGDCASVFVQSERDISDTREKNKSSFSTPSNKTNNAINNVNNFITNLKNDLNYNPINSRIISNNQRYNPNILNNTSVNESAIDLINMNIQNSTSNLNLSLNSKQAFVESNNNTIDNINESEVFSTEDKKKITLNPEKSVKYVNVNNKKQKSDICVNNLKGNLDKQRRESNNSNLDDKMSCAQCEEFYKISIMYNVSLKEMKCLYCNNILNSSSMEFYRLRYKPIEEEKEKFNTQNSSLLNKSSMTEKNASRPESGRREPNVYPKQANLNTWQEFTSQNSKQSFNHKNYEIIDNNLIRLNSARKNLCKENIQEDYNVRKHDTNSNVKRKSLKNFDTIENISYKTDSNKHDGYYNTKESIVYNINNLENLYKKKKMLFDKEKRSLKIESNQQDINVLDNLKKTYDSHQMSPIKNHIKYEKNQDSIHKYQNGKNIREHIIRTDDKFLLSVNEDEIMQGYKSKSINDCIKEEFVNESSNTARDSLNNYALFNHKHQNYEKYKDEPQPLHENNCKEKDPEKKIENNKIVIDINQYAFNFNKEDILGDSYSLSRKDNENESIHEKKKKDAFTKREEDEQIDDINDDENNSIEKETNYNYVQEESEMNDNKYNLNNQGEEINENTKDLIKAKENQEVISSSDEEKDAEEDKSYQEKEAPTNTTTKKKINFKIDIIHQTPEINTEKYEADQSEINFHIDVNNRTSNSKNNQFTITLDSPLSNQIDDKFEYDTEHIVLGNYFCEDDEENSSVNKIKHDFENKGTTISKFRKSKEKALDKSDEEDYNIKQNEIYKEIMGSQMENDKDDLMESNKMEIQGQYFNHKNNEMSIIYEDVTNMKEDDSSEIMIRRKLTTGKIEEYRHVEEGSLDKKNDPFEINYGDENDMDNNYLNQVFSQGEEEKIEENENEVKEESDENNIENFNYGQTNQNNKNIKIWSQRINQNYNFTIEKQNDEQISMKEINNEKYFSPQRNLSINEKEGEYFTLGKQDDKFMSIRNLMFSPEKSRDENLRKENQIIILQKMSGAGNNIPFENFDLENESEESDHVKIQDIHENTNNLPIYKQNFTLDKYKGEKFNIPGGNISNEKRKEKSNIQQFNFERQSGNNFNIVNQKINLNIQTGEAFEIEKLKTKKGYQEPEIVNIHSDNFNIEFLHGNMKKNKNFHIDKQIEENFNNHEMKSLLENKGEESIHDESKDINYQRQSSGIYEILNRNLILQKENKENINIINEYSNKHDKQIENINIDNSKYLVEKHGAEKLNLEIKKINLEFKSVEDSSNSIVSNSHNEKQNVEENNSPIKSKFQLEFQNEHNFYLDNSNNIRDEQTINDELIKCKKFLLNIQNEENVNLKNEEFDLTEQKTNDDIIKYKKFLLDIQQGENLNVDHEDSNKTENKDFYQSKEKQKFYFDIQQGENFEYENKNICINKKDDLKNKYQQFSLEIQNAEDLIFENEDKMISEDIYDGKYQNNIIQQGNNIYLGENYNFSINKQENKYLINHKNIITNNKEGNKNLYLEGEKNDEDDNLDLKEYSQSNLPHHKIQSNINIGFEITCAVKNLIINEKVTEKDFGISDNIIGSENDIEKSNLHNFETNLKLSSKMNKDHKISSKYDNLIDDDNKNCIKDDNASNESYNYVNFPCKSLSKFKISNEVINITLNEKMEDKFQDYKINEEGENNIRGKEYDKFAKRKDVNKLDISSRPILLEEILEDGTGEFYDDDEEDNLSQNKLKVINITKPNVYEIFKENVEIFTVSDNKMKSKPYVFDHVIEGADPAIEYDCDQDYTECNPMHINHNQIFNINNIKEEGSQRKSSNQNDLENDSKSIFHPDINFGNERNIIIHQKSESSSEQINKILNEGFVDDCPGPEIQLPSSLAAYEIVNLSDSIKPSVADVAQNVKDVLNFGNKIKRNILNQERPDLSRNLVDNSNLVISKPREPLQPIRIKKKNFTNSISLVNSIQSDLKTFSTILNKDSEKEKPNERKSIFQPFNKANDIKIVNDKKISDFAKIGREDRRISMKVKDKPNFLNSELKINSINFSRSSTDKIVLDPTIDSLDESSKILTSDKGWPNLEIKDIGHAHKLSENSTTLKSKEHSRVTSGKNTLTSTSKTESSITQPGLNDPRRVSDKMPSNKTLVLPTYDFRRVSQKVTNIKGLLTSSINEPLSVTEKKLAMAEILNKGLNETSRLAEKRHSEKPKIGFLGDLSKTSTLMERNTRKSLLTVITKVKYNYLIISQKTVDNTFNK